MKNIVLASSSRRRSSILLSCGIKHKVIPSNVTEDMKGRSPCRIVMSNACLKAKEVAEKIKEGLVIGADTVVLLDKKIIGKPMNVSHAKMMLKSMSGKAIYVYTGICVIDAKTKKIALDYERSEVRVKNISESEISRYFRLLGPYDKAGGFSIEGAGSFIFDDINGSYFNVLGLPMARLKDMFEKIGVDILKIIKK